MTSIKADISTRTQPAERKAESERLAVKSIRVQSDIDKWLAERAKEAKRG